MRSWAPAVDQLLADEQVDDLFNAANNEILWAPTDHLGSVRDVVDDAGTVRLHREFKAYGAIAAETHYNASGVVITEGDPGYVTTIVAYTGKFLDSFTSLQNSWHRWCDAETELGDGIGADVLKIVSIAPPNLAPLAGAEKSGKAARKEDGPQRHVADDPPDCRAPRQAESVRIRPDC